MKQLSYFRECYFDFEVIEREIQRQADMHLAAVFSGESETTIFELTSKKGRLCLVIQFTELKGNEVSIDLEKLLDEEIHYASLRDDPVAEMDVTLKSLNRLSRKLEAAMKRGFKKTG